MSSATAINESGQVVGYSETQLGLPSPTHAFLWQAGNLQDLGSLGGFSSTAADINNKGMVVGSVIRQDSSGSAFLWSNGNVTSIAVPGAITTTATRINDKGDVAGIYLGADLVQSGFFYSGGALQLIKPTGAVIRVFGLSQGGDVLGSMEKPEYANTPSSTRAFVWSAGVLMDLNTRVPANSPWILAAAIGINERGQIIATGVRKDQASGYVQALLLTPD